MLSKRKLLASVLVGFLTPVLLFSAPAVGSGMSAAEIKSSKKMSQKTLKVTTTQTQFYFGFEVILRSTGGSGTGQVSFNVVSGNCKHVSGKLFTRSQVPTTCWVQATKSADKKYLATKSASKKIYFTYLPGTANFNDLSRYGLDSYSLGLSDSRSTTISSYINSIVSLSNQSSVRYRAYWSALNGFWSKSESNLQANIQILKTREIAQRELGLVDSAQKTKETWVFQQELLDISSAMKNLTWANYLRDIKYFQ